MDIFEELAEVAKLTPVLVRVYSDAKRRVVAAKSAASPGGTTCTPAEIAAIVEAETPALTHAITELLADLS